MGLTTFEFDALAREATAQEIQGGGPGGWTGGRGEGGGGGGVGRRVKLKRHQPHHAPIPYACPNVYIVSILNMSSRQTPTGNAFLCTGLRRTHIHAVSTNIYTVSLGSIASSVCKCSPASTVNNIPGHKIVSSFCFYSVLV